MQSNKLDHRLDHGVVEHSIVLGISSGVDGLW